MNCCTCKHWRNLETSDCDPEYWRRHASHADNVVNLKLYGVCSKIADAPSAAPNSMPLALAVDAEDYSAALLTLPAFSCALFREKNDPSEH